MLELKGFRLVVACEGVVERGVEWAGKRSEADEVDFFGVVLLLLLLAEVVALLLLLLIDDELLFDCCLIYDGLRVLDDVLFDGL